MRIGIGKGRTRRGIANAQMIELTLHAGQASANFPQTVSPSDLTEKHGNKLRPAIKSFGGPVRLLLLDRSLEVRARKNLQQLAKDTAKLHHGGEPPLRKIGFSSLPSSLQRGSPFNFSNRCLGQE